MARQVRRISELPEATELTGDELLEIVQDGENHRVTVDQLSGGGAVQSVQGRTGDVVITADDVGLGSVDNTSDADKPVSVAQQMALDEKVDAEEGMGLSSNDFTDPLREKLIGLEGTHWRGTFVSLAALQAGVTDPEAGDYADVDVVGDDVVRYIWDATDGIWVVQSGAVAPITASQVKQLYESNPDTNAFTDADEAKLGDVQPWATAPTLDAAQTALGLGTAATRDVGTSSGQVPEFVSNGEGLGGFGYGRVGTSVGRYTDVNDVPKRTGFYLLTEGHPNSTNNKAPLAGFYDTCIVRTLRQSSNDFVDVYLPYPNYSPGMVIAPHTSSGYATQRIVSDSVNLRTSTGNSTIYPMSQKAVTDALNTKIDLSDVTTDSNGFLKTGQSVPAGQEGVTKAQLDSALGDISSALDAINGEVV